MDRKKRVVTAQQMKAIEKNAAESGLSYYQMMENAGTMATNFIKEKRNQLIVDKNIVVFCGKGNNGGDGFVVARQLHQSQGNVVIILVDGEPKTEDAITNYEITKRLGIKIKRLPEEEGEVATLIGEADVVVDAIYGTGFRGELRESARKATMLINQSSAPIFSLDIPSGVNGDNGEADIDSVKAAFTIAFDSYKPAHFMENTIVNCGEVVCVDIGIDEDCHDV